MVHGNLLHAAELSTVRFLWVLVGDQSVPGDGGNKRAFIVSVRDRGPNPSENIIKN